MSVSSFWPRFVWYRSAREATVRAQPAYAMLFGVLLACASALDVVIGGEQVNAWTLLWAFSIGLGAGLLIGTGFSFALTRLRTAPGWLLVLLWMAAAGGVTAWLIIDLNVPNLMSGKERQLALIALAASIAVGISVLIGGYLVQPRRHYPQGWIASMRLRYRVPLLIGLILLAGGASWADRNTFDGTYPSAHLALRWAGLCSALLAAIALFPRRPSPQIGTRIVVGVGVAVTVIFPFATLRPTDYGELSAILEEPYSRLAIKVVRTIGDPDMDGYSVFLGGGDCDTFDPHVNPGAAEIPGNGLDDNCRWGDAHERAPIGDPDAVPIPDSESPMSVILITIDTLRADRMSAYGAKRDTTPGIKAWADSKAVRFNKAYTGGGWTSLALSSLFRGVYPRRLTWSRLYETTKWRLLRAPYEDKLEEGETQKRIYGMPLEKELRKTLPWWLQRRGMSTVAVVDDGFSEFLSPALGVDNGFEIFAEVDDLPKSKQNDKGTTDLAIEQLKKMPKDKPYFLWVHYFGPHNPSKVNPGVKTFGKSGIDKYDHEIRFVDQEATRLLDTIQTYQKTQKIAVILTADHGEVIKGNWRNHGVNVAEAAINVPLFLSVPGQRAQVSERLVSLVDIMPTVMALTDTPPPPELDGRDLRAILMDPEEAAKKRIVFSEVWHYGKDGDTTGDQIAVTDGVHKLEWNLNTEAKKLWRLSDRDSSRKENLLGKVEVPNLEAALNTYLEENGKVKLVD